MPLGGFESRKQGRGWWLPETLWSFFMTSIDSWQYWAREKKVIVIEPPWSDVVSHGAWGKSCRLLWLTPQMPSRRPSESRAGSTCGSPAGSWSHRTLSPPLILHCRWRRIRLRSWSEKNVIKMCSSDPFLPLPSVGRKEQWCLKDPEERLLRKYFVLTSNGSASKTFAFHSKFQLSTLAYRLPLAFVSDYGAFQSTKKMANPCQAFIVHLIKNYPNWAKKNRLYLIRFTGKSNVCVMPWPIRLT